jgi:hypothetical protein
MTEAGPSDAAQPSGEAALAGADSTAAAQPAGLNDEQKQAQLIASERQYQQGVQAIRVTQASMFAASQQQCLAVSIGPMHVPPPRSQCAAWLALQDNRLEDAVELFGKCLETRVAAFGGACSECQTSGSSNVQSSTMLDWPPNIAAHSRRQRYRRLVQIFSHGLLSAACTIMLLLSLEPKAAQSMGKPILTAGQHTRCRPRTDQAAECGGAYYRYGAALFYKAQYEADVFGDNLQDAAEKHDAQVGF